MKEQIIKNWDSIMKLLETQYDVSKIIIETWIRNLEIYEMKDNTVYDRTPGIANFDELDNSKTRRTKLSGKTNLLEMEAVHYEELIKSEPPLRK